MRFLKNKIAFAQAAKEKKQKLQSPSLSDTSDTNEIETTYSLASPQISLATTPSISRPQKIKTHATVTNPQPNIRATKNIVKNYAHAILTFAQSPIAVPYLTKFCQQERVDMRGFIEFIKPCKAKMEGIHQFRAILLIVSSDSEKVANYKRVFRQLCEVFIKFFSVNWIFNSKVVHKQVHLKYRFMLLRRVRNPEMFTYLSPFKAL